MEPTTDKIKVIIFGGGVSGLSAAHHLLTKGNGLFEVEIYERRNFGGKARSAVIKDEDNNELPTEHGFRFFPGFYKHITKTLKEIPFGDNGRTVYNNLVNIDYYSFLFSNKSGRLDVPINIGTLAIRGKFKEIIRRFKKFNKQFHEAKIDITSEGKNKFVDSMLEVYTSCNARIESTYDNISWSDFIDAKDLSGKYGKDYENLLATGISKNLVAVRADVANARTGAKLIGHMLWHIAVPFSARADKILNAPTNVAWIEPWLKYLKGKGLKTYLNQRVVSLDFDNERKIITGIRYDCVDKADHKSWDFYDDKRISKLPIAKADYYISAMPIERVDEMLENSKSNKKIIISHFDPALSNFEKIWVNTEWMNGIMFYFDTEIKIPNGHITIADEEAAVTMISQLQYWGKYLENNKLYFKDKNSKDKKEVKAIISVIVSNWDAESKYITNPEKKNRLKLKDLTIKEVIEEIQIILFRCEDSNGKKIGTYKNNLVCTFLDDSIVEFNNDKFNPRYMPILGEFSIDNKDEYDTNKYDSGINNLNEHPQPEYIVNQIKEAYSKVLKKDSHSNILHNEVNFSSSFKPYNLYNKEPLYINKTHSYHLRPTGYTSFDNFFLAGDYIKTNADLGCMDSADEAARRAVNNIFIKEKLHARCKIGNYDLPSFTGLFNTSRMLDYRDFKKGLAYRKNLFRKLFTWYFKKLIYISNSDLPLLLKVILFLGMFLLLLLASLVNLVYKFILKQVHVKGV